MKTISEITAQVANKQLLSAGTPRCSGIEMQECPQNEQNGTVWRRKWLGLCEDTHPEVKSLCEGVQAWVYRVLAGDRTGRLLVIAGRNGVGKSMAARAAIRAIGALAASAWAFRAARGVETRPSPPTSAEYSWSMLSNSTPEERAYACSIWRDAVETDAVLLDDVGAETDRFNTGQPIENLRLMLEARRNRWTAITTNIPPSKWATEFDSRVEDRLYRNAVHLLLPTAPSYSKLPRRKRN